MIEADELHLRPATMADAGLLFGWVNASDSLPNKMATVAPVEWPTHQQWLRARIADPDCLLEIVELDSRPVGQVRLEPGDGGTMVDIYIAPAFRRSGLARTALAEAFARCAARPIVALVKPDNAPSRALFRSLGFREIGAEGALSVFQLED